MNQKLVILALVITALAVVLAVKLRQGNQAGSAADAPTSSTATGEPASQIPTVMLFADPREADSSCGCAEVIRLARGAGEREGVVFAEYDPRVAGTEAERHHVRVSPTVLVLDADGHESARFEGESPAVIAKLRDAMGELETR